MPCLDDVIVQPLQPVFSILIFLQLKTAVASGHTFIG